MCVLPENRTLTETTSTGANHTQTEFIIMNVNGCHWNMC